jgi:hypothetical protein
MDTHNCTTFKALNRYAIARCGGRRWLGTGIPLWPNLPVFAAASISSANKGKLTKERENFAEKDQD